MAKKQKVIQSVISKPGDMITKMNEEKRKSVGDKKKLAIIGMV